MFRQLSHYSWFRFLCVLPLACGFLIVSCFADYQGNGYWYSYNYKNSSGSNLVSVSVGVNPLNSIDRLDSGSYSITLNESQYNSVETGTLTETVNEGSTGENYQMATPSFTVAPLTGTVSNASSLTVSPKGTSDRVLHFNSNGYTVYGTNTTTGTRTSVNAAHSSTGSLVRDNTQDLYVHKCTYNFVFSPSSVVRFSTPLLYLPLYTNSNVLGISDISDFRCDSGFLSPDFHLYYDGSTHRQYITFRLLRPFDFKFNDTGYILPHDDISMSFTVSYLTASDSINFISNYTYNPSATVAALSDSAIQSTVDLYTEFTSAGNNSAINTVVSGSNGLSNFGDSIESISTSISQVWHTDLSASPELVFPAYSLPISSGSEVTYYELWPNMTFNFDWIQNNWGFSALKTALNFATVYAVYRGLLSYLIAVYDALMQGYFKNDLY